MIKVIDPSYSKDVENLALEILNFQYKPKVFLAGTIDTKKTILAYLY